jgi:integrase
MALPLRRGETSRLRWGYINAAEAVIEFPGDITKNGDPFRVAINAPAARVLSAALAACGGKADRNSLIFQAARRRIAGDGERPVSGWSKISKNVFAAAGLSDANFTLHDVRRAFVTLLSRERTDGGGRRFDQALLDLCLNHRAAATRGGVIAIYNQDLRWPERKAAIEHWGRLLDEALTPKPEKGSNVEPLFLRA